MSSQTTGQPISPGAALRTQASVPLITELITKHSYCTKHCTSSASPLLSSFSSCLESTPTPNHNRNRLGPVSCTHFLDHAFFQPPLAPGRSFPLTPTDLPHYPPQNFLLWQCHRQQLGLPSLTKPLLTMLSYGTLFRAHAHSLLLFPWKMSYL